jgi:hypothetical protein
MQRQLCLIVGCATLFARMQLGSVFLLGAPQWLHLITSYGLAIGAATWLVNASKIAERAQGRLLVYGFATVGLISLNWQWIFKHLPKALSWKLGYVAPSVIETALQLLVLFLLLRIVATLQPTATTSSAT